MKKVSEKIELTLSELNVQNTEVITTMCKYVKKKFPNTEITLRCNVLWEYVKNTPLMKYIDYLIVNHTVKMVAINDEEQINVKESLDTGIKVIK